MTQGSGKKFQWKHTTSTGEFEDVSMEKLKDTYEEFFIEMVIDEMGVGETAETDFRIVKRII